MRHPFLLFAPFCALMTAQAQPVPVDQLLKPPANAQKIIILSSAAQHGRSFRWVGADGTHYGRESMNLRGQIFEVDSETKLGADGMIDRLTVRGFTPQGDAAETFSIENG